MNSPPPLDGSSLLPYAPKPGFETGRAHRLGPQPGVIKRAAIAAQTALESAIARVSRLHDQPVYAVEDFPWVTAVEAYWPAIRAELDSILLERMQLPSFHEILDEVRTITQDDQWKTFWLVGAGIDTRVNAARCPQTMAALQRIPGVVNAFFSMLAPGKIVPAHRGAYNGILRYHLGVRVPQPHWLAGIRVADRICHWQDGASLIFDDSFNHEAWNGTDDWRVVLFVDFARPLKPPFDGLHRALLRAGALLPLMRRARQRHRQWQQRFERTRH